MIDEQLRASSEEIGEGRCAFVGLEAVLLSIRTQGSSAAAALVRRYAGQRLLGLE